MRHCPDCDAAPGELHELGCDVERCPRCGGQAMSCRCIYEVCGLNFDTLEVDNSDIYLNGPTSEMFAMWDAEWGSRRMPWSGIWPGASECHEYGFWAQRVAGKGWVPCAQDAPGATEHLSRLAKECVWDRDQQRFVKPGR